MNEQAITAYHGTNASDVFDKFSLSHAGTATDAGHLGHGIYLSTDPNIKRGKARLITTQLTLKNPLRLKMPDFHTDKREVLAKAIGRSGMNSMAITNHLRSRGHDGVELDYSPTGYNHKEYVAFDPSSVKIVSQHSEDQHKYSSTHFNLPPELCSKIRQLAEHIEHADLEGDGIETEPHITIKYGLHTNSPDDVTKAVADQSPVAVQFDKCSVFAGDEHDVVKIEIVSRGIHRLNAVIAERLECTDTFPVYQPHCTIAYVKPGLGKKYADMFNALGDEVHPGDSLLDSVVSFNRLTFSSKDRACYDIGLYGTAQFRETKGERWITIGGKSGGDGTGEHHGGFPVKIDSDGNIIAGGPKMLHGTNVSAVKHTFDRQRHNEAAAFERASPIGKTRSYKAIVKHQAEKWGMTPGLYHEHAEQVWHEKTKHHNEREKAKRWARERMHATKGTLDSMDRHYKDVASLKGADGLATEFASMFPSLGITGAHGDDQKIWNLIHEGKQELPAKHTQEYHDAVEDHLSTLLSGQAWSSEKPKKKKKAVVDDSFDFGANAFSEAFHKSGTNPFTYNTHSTRDWVYPQNSVEYDKHRNIPEEDVTSKIGGVPKVVGKVRTVHGYHKSVATNNGTYYLNMDPVSHVHSEGKIGSIARSLHNKTKVVPYSFSFHNSDGNFGITGTGGSHRVISEVAKHMDAALRHKVRETGEHHFPLIHFSSAEKSRSRLYDHLALNATKHHPYKAFKLKNGGLDHYILAHSKHASAVEDALLDSGIGRYQKIQGTKIPKSFSVKNAKADRQSKQIEQSQVDSQSERFDETEVIQFKESDESRQKIMEFMLESTGSRIKTAAEAIRSLATSSVNDAVLASIIEHEIRALQQPLSADLAVANYSTHIATMADVIKEVPSFYLSAKGGPPPEPPVPPATALFPPGEPPQGVTFPVLDDAIATLSDSPAAVGANYLETAAAIRQGAFAVTADLTTKAVEDIRNTLAESMRLGESRVEWVDKIAKRLEGEGSPLSPAHLETIFRTNTMEAMSGAKQRAMSNPLVSDGFPYVAYSATHDARARPEHRALETLGLNGTNIYRANDPVFLKFRPPWSWQCRCNFLPVSVTIAAKKGVQEAVAWLDRAKAKAESQGGTFWQYLSSESPATPEFVASPPFEPDPSFQRNPIA